MSAPHPSSPRPPRRPGTPRGHDASPSDTRRLLRLADDTAPAGRRVLVAGAAAVPVATILRDVEPDADVLTADTTLDALAELALASGGLTDRFDLVVADAREAAEVEALRRQLDGDTDHADASPRLVLIGDDAVRLADFGADASLAADADAWQVVRACSPASGPVPASRAGVAPASAVPHLTAEALLEAVVDRPGQSMEAVVRRLAADCDALPDASPPLALIAADAEANGLAVSVAGTNRRLVWRGTVRDDAERDVVLHDLRQLADALARLASADERHARLQKLALCDDLTGCANKRYFRHFLDRILGVARRERFPVTLLLFDIDDFKHYNDRHGHATGDAILRQTGDLIRRCVRDHDFVARIGGDEFAVVFWEKADTRAHAEADGDDAAEGHRRGIGRVPKGPLQIATRFRRLMSQGEFDALGEAGVGRLTISGGMSVFPYDAHDADALVAAADNALVFGAKAGGKNAIALVGREDDDGQPA